MTSGPASPVEENQYEVRHGRMFWMRATRDGIVPTELCNFVATIEKEEVHDDGASRKRLLLIGGLLEGKEPLATLRVPVERFSGMRWPLEGWGSRAVVKAGFGSSDRLREAIQTLSGDVPQEIFVAHTGWRRENGMWAYYHGDGAIGPNGPLPNVRVQLPHELTPFRFPAPSSNEETRAAIRCSLEVRDLAAPTITVPLLGAVMHAPICEVSPADFSMHVSGKTGVFKSELAAIAQAHYGIDFTRVNLPSNWGSTANALQRLAFVAKDGLLVIDDFAPTGTQHDVQRLHGVAENLLRSVGNRSGRIRMSADGDLRPTFFPRGLVLSTGEDVPRGQSLRARIWNINLAPSAIVKEKLSVLQEYAARGVFVQGMSAYVRWLAGRFETLRESFPAHVQKLRSLVSSEGHHARTADMVALLAAAWNLWRDFAEDAGAIDAMGHAKLRESLWNSLLQGRNEQADLQSVEDPVTRFADLLSSAIATGKAHLARPNGGAPLAPQAWGWVAKAGGPEEDPLIYTAKAALIGWVAEDEPGTLYLDPHASYALAQQFAQQQQQSLAIGPRTLWQRMAERDLLATRDGARKKLLVRRAINGQRRHVLHVFTGLLDGKAGLWAPPSPPGPTGPKGPAAGDGATEATSGGKGEGNPGDVPEAPGPGPAAE